MLVGGVFVSMTQGPTGVLGFVPGLPDKHVVPPKGEHARRFDFRYERFRNKSLDLAGRNEKKPLFDELGELAVSCLTLTFQDSPTSSESALIIPPIIHRHCD